MLFPALSLAATLWAAVTPVAGPAPVPAADLLSTYDEATCAALYGGESDDWNRSAIGELIPAEVDCGQSLAPPRAPLAKLDCDDPAPWAGTMIGSCAIPRGTGLPGLRAAHDQRRAVHALELAIAANETIPLSPPRNAPDTAPLHASVAPNLSTPNLQAFASHWQLFDLRSVAGEVPLRPPRA